MTSPFQVSSSKYQVASAKYQVPESRFFSRLETCALKLETGGRP